MILTDLLCVCIILFILIRVPNQSETNFGQNLLKSVPGNSTSPKNVRRQFDFFIWGLIFIFLFEYITFNFILIN